MKNQFTKFIVLLVALLLGTLAANATPIDDLLERIDKGASKRIMVRIAKSKGTTEDYFRLSQQGARPMIEASDYVSAAVGVNWYLKYYCGIHLTWNCMQAPLPKTLPSISTPERHATHLRLRYNLNYCTFSYSMAFWDWERWEREIDWMALHGINMPLAAVGVECVWRNLLLRLGYSEEEIGRFVAGPAFLAWWEMNNLEGWGGPLPLSWYQDHEDLQRKILARMREYGMKPVLPGYSGMVPSQMASHPAEEIVRGKDSGESAQSTIKRWNGYTRPGMLMPGDPRFATYARLYYEEATRLYGTADYYSMDPFHEASHLPKDMDFGAAGKAILSHMKAANPKATWVVQGWTENPREEMLAAIEPADILVLDLFSECRPMWGIPSIWQREQGYGPHHWLFCLLENFGGNIGLHGRMDQLLENFYQTRTHPLATHMKGIGLTMEGIETNPMMYELMCELPWRPERVDRNEWLARYAQMRYGMSLPQAREAWQLLGGTIYNCPRGNNQQGPSESIFCGRPSMQTYQASSWSKMVGYYDPASTLRAAQLMAQAAPQVVQAQTEGRLNEAAYDNFAYDIVDITRQAIADRARVVYHQSIADFKSHSVEAFEEHRREFLTLLLMQDSLLSTRREFCVGRRIEQARALAHTPEESRLYEWNARVQITTWGNRYCADTGKLRDYAHKEWSGLLRDFYHKRWDHFYSILSDELHGRLPMLPVGNSSTPPKDNPALTIDWYAIEEPWTLQQTTYPALSSPQAVDLAVECVKALNGKQSTVVI